MDPWPFADPRNTAAITTRQVLEGAPIVRVSHDADDGGWQFLGDTSLDPADARVVGLGRMVDRDATLASIADLPEGWQAWRSGPGGAWQRGPA